MTIILTLKPAIKSDYLRGGPLQLKELQTRSPSEKWLKLVMPGDKFTIEKVTATKGNFTQVKLAKPIAGESWWWCYSENFLIPKPEEKKLPVVEGYGLPSQVKLSLPYLSQLDNTHNPLGSCNVSSVAMCLGFFGHALVNAEGVQLEDQLYRICEMRGLSRHSPTDLEKLIRLMGYSDNFKADAQWPNVKKWLADGKPCIAHGYWTRFGHIVALAGYNEKGFVVFDPYGEWHSDGYDTSASGEGLTYSYQMMERVCGPSGDLWIHFVGR